MQSVSSIMPVVNISDKNSVPATCFKDVMPCEVSPLGFHLLLSVKENIWKREIVKVLSLLPSATQFSSRYDRKSEGA